MKKMKLNFKLVFLALTFGATTLFGQTTVTNTANSKYQFTEIARLGNTPVLSQGMTGTCWSFSTISFFESELMRMGMKDVPRLSEMYIARKAYEDKAEKYIRMDGKVNFGQGGEFHDIPYIMNKYGIVPQEVYTGLVDGEKTYNHDEMFSILEGTVKAIVARAASGKTISEDWKKGFDATLDAYIGKDPKTFTYNGKEYTPKSFFESLHLNLDDYMSFTSFTNYELNKPCILEIPDNWLSRQSYNVSLDDLFNITVEALKNGYTVAWGSDVSEKGFSFKNGIAVAPVDPSTITVKGKDNKNFSDAGADRTSNAFLEPVTEVTVTPELRQKGFDNKSTTDDHGMHIVGLYKDQTGKLFFLVKNSWGTSNYPQGYLFVSENYFKLKTIGIYVNKGGVPKAILKKIGK